MPFAWINENIERDLSDIYETLGHLAMMAGHPYKSLVRARGPDERRAGRRARAAMSMDRYESKLRRAVRE